MRLLDEFYGVLGVFQTDVFFANLSTSEIRLAFPYCDIQAMATAITAVVSIHFSIGIFWIDVAAVTHTPSI